MSLKLINLNYKIKDKVILDSINLDFGNGIHALLGLNGVGKTSLLNIISTLNKANSGEILYNNVSIIGNNKPLLKDLGYMSQNVGLIQDFTIEQNLYYFGLLKGCGSKYLKNKIPFLLEIFNLFSDRKTRAGNLSGGLKQRVGIALALINNPKILILDEPINNLDSYEREKLYHILKEISKNCIVIISTHLINDISKFSDKIIIMTDGKICFTGKTKQIIDEDTTIESLFSFYTKS